MVRLSYLLRPKYELYRRHDERLRTAPQPFLARTRFQKRLKETARTQRFRLFCFIGIYSTVILGVLSLVLGAVVRIPRLLSALGAIGGILSSLTVVFVAGVFITGRVLSYLEVDLQFYSQESRMPEPAGWAPPSEAADDDD